MLQSDSSMSGGQMPLPVAPPAVTLVPTSTAAASLLAGIYAHVRSPAAATPPAPATPAAAPAPPAAALRATFSLFPASLEATAGLGAPDCAPPAFGRWERHFVPPEARLVVGKYAPELGGYVGNNAGGGDGGGGKASDGSDNDDDNDGDGPAPNDGGVGPRRRTAPALLAPREVSTATTTATTAVNGSTGSSSPAPVRVALCRPLYPPPLSVGTIYFPIAIAPATTKDAADPRGTPASLQASLHGPSGPMPDPPPPTGAATAAATAAPRAVAARGDSARTRPLYKIGPGAVAFKVVVNALEAGGLAYTPHDALASVLWLKRLDASTTLARLGRYQKVNHFPGTWGLGRKDALHKNLSAARRAFAGLGGEPAKFFDVAPATFLLPAEHAALARDCAAYIAAARRRRLRGETSSEADAGASSDADPSGAPDPRDIPTYIVKPVASSCGKGISLVKGMPPTQPPPSPAAAAAAAATGGRPPRGRLVQRYVPRPLLVDGRKFDLRMYGVATSFDPLRLYLFDQGLVRFAAVKYPGPDAQLGNIHCHLTNYSVNCTAALRREGGTDASSDAPVDVKWVLSDLKAHFVTSLGPVAGSALWARVEAQAADIFVKLALAVEPAVVSELRSGAAAGSASAAMRAFGASGNADSANAAASAAGRGAPAADASGRGCFELYGLDLMLDDAGRMTVLEVNIMPSLATGTSLDKAVKARLLAHTLTLVGVHAADRVAAAQETTWPGGTTAAAANGSRPLLPPSARFYYSLPNAAGARAWPTAPAGARQEQLDAPLLPLEAFRGPACPASALPPGVAAPSLAELATCLEGDEEAARGGGFRRVFPTAAATPVYLPYFLGGVSRSNYVAASWEAAKAAAAAGAAQAAVAGAGAA